jgi:hypothetical protein
MSFGSKSGPSTTNQSNTQTNSVAAAVPPDWYTNAWQSILASGQDLTNNLNYQVAGLTPDQMNASGFLNDAISGYMTRNQIPAYDVFGMGNQWQTGNPSVQQGGGGATAAEGQAAHMAASQLAPDQIAPFMNPYIDTALNPVVNRLAQQDRERQADIAGRAAASSMFGGSTQAVQSAMADRDYRQQLAETAGSMLKGGFDTAAGLAGTNVDRRQQAAMQNAQMQQQANMQNAQMQTAVSQSNAQNQTQRAIAGGAQGVGYANLLMQSAQNDANRFLNALQLQGNLDSQSMQSLVNALQVLNQFGGQQQATAQRGLDTYTGLNTMLQGLLRGGGFSPGLTTTTNTTSAQQGAGQTQRPIDLASILTGGLGLLSRL